MMEHKPNKPLRLDKDGNPYPEKKAVARKIKPGEKPAQSSDRKTGKSAHAAKPVRAAKPVKKKPEVKAVPVKHYPIDWFFLHTGECTVARLKEIFLQVPELDVECWPELGIIELTFPSKVFIDFEPANDPDDTYLQEQITAHSAKTAYYVSVEPDCTDADIAFLKETAQKTGGIFVADDDHAMIIE